jgi:CRISPR/Cas system CSM-associated protein Csm2 small subunit
MKKSELRILVAKYKETKIKLSKSKNEKLKNELKLIEHRYYHETGRTIKSDLEEIT